MRRDEFRTVMMARLRGLIEDRFQLKTHRETKEMQIYGLVVAKGGSKLQPMQPGGRESSLNISRGDDANMRV
ncbi:MAG TPA: TIGR03435 family protein, partial [Bryobacteraceae bacterium]|nr:TIGR03435 family protein [Bryobacteraceae bacterium]